MIIQFGGRVLRLCSVVRGWAEIPISWGASHDDDAITGGVLIALLVPGYCCHQCHLYSCACVGSE